MRRCGSAHRWEHRVLFGAALIACRQGSDVAGRHDVARNPVNDDFAHASHVSEDPREPSSDGLDQCDRRSLVVGSCGAEQVRADDDGRKMMTGSSEPTKSPSEAACASRAGRSSPSPMTAGRTSAPCCRASATASTSMWTPQTRKNRPTTLAASAACGAAEAESRGSSSPGLHFEETLELKPSRMATKISPWRDPQSDAHIDPTTRLTPVGLSLDRPRLRSMSADGPG